MILLTIHEVALPQTTSTMSFRMKHQPFQKCSSALTKSDFRVSIQGSSSRNTTFLAVLLADNPFCKAKKASDQFRIRPLPFMPKSSRDLANSANCAVLLRLARPEWKNAICLPSVSLIRNVFPTRRRPYMATNSERSDLMAFLSLSASFSLPISMRISP